MHILCEVRPPAFHEAMISRCRAAFKRGFSVQPPCRASGGKSEAEGRACRTMMRRSTRARIRKMLRGACVRARYSVYDALCMARLRTPIYSARSYEARAIMRRARRYAAAYAQCVPLRTTLVYVAKRYALRDAARRDARRRVP